MAMPRGTVPWIKVVLFGAIPAIAVLVAARQAYLNAYHGLSAWKGGGMGMFASADGSDTRFTRIYVETSDGRREPIIRLAEPADTLMQQVLWYPSESNIRSLAQALRRMTFIASDQPTAVNRLDAKGNVLGPTGTKHLLLYADGLRPAGDEPSWTLVIEYWTISFNPSTRLASAVLSKTLRFGPEKS